MVLPLQVREVMYPPIPGRLEQPFAPPYNRIDRVIDPGTLAMGRSYPETAACCFPRRDSLNLTMVRFGSFAGTVRNWQ